MDVINHTQSLLKELGKEHPFYVRSNQLLGRCKEFDILFEPIEEKNARSLIKYVSSMMVYVTWLLTTTMLLLEIFLMETLM